MLRLGSLVIGLALIGMMMQMVQSPGAKQKLALMFGDAPPAASQAGNTVNQAESPTYLPNVDPAKLDTIEDNTWLRDEEADVWFHLLSAVRSATPDQLQAASVGEAAYAQLLGQPEVYRGRVVQLEGEAKRVERIAPAANDLGIEHLYLIHIQPSRDLLRPFAIYCQQLPEGWTVAGEIPDNGRMNCHAIFFKNKVYNHQTGVDLMPVFLAGGITSVGEPTPLVDRTPSMPAWQMAALAVLVAGILVMCIAWRNDDQQRPATHVDARELAQDLQALTAEQGDEGT